LTVPNFYFTMKNRIFIFLITAGLSTLAIVFTAHSRDEENKVYSKSGHLDIREAGNRDAKKVGEAQWNEPLDVLESKNRWLKVSGKHGEGWVYAGSVSKEKLAEVNKNQMPGQTSGVTDTAASRGWTAGAQEYAQSHDLGEVAEQIKWAEQQNLKVSPEDAREYLKSHNLGEYAGGNK
jgi:hypothetical protein